MDRFRLAVVIPAHREASSIEAIVRGALPHAAVIVVDDCSPDATGARAAAAGAQVVRSEERLGYEAAIDRGFQKATEQGFTHVITMDADGEHDPAFVEMFRELLIDDRVQLVLGVRPRRQRLSESIMATYVRARWGVSDILCGMKGYDINLYRLNRGFSHKDSIGTELALNSVRLGVPFKQTPVGGKRRADQPRFDGNLRANVRILRALLKIFLEDIRSWLR